MAVGIGVFAMPFTAFTELILYQFYIKGSFLLDAGWFAFVMSAGAPHLPNPQALGGSFLSVHVAPIFLATAALKQALPVTDAQFFAAFIGLGHALPALGVYWVLRSGFGLRSPSATVLAGIIAVAFAFNGLALAIARYPHVEILIVGGAILFAVALVQRRFAFAGVFFVVTLAVREDAGLHLFAILFVLAIVNRWYGIGRQAQRAEIAFAVAALAYSVAILAVQHWLLGAGEPSASAFSRIYLGDPPFAKLTGGIVAERLLGWLVYRAYLVWPALIALFWAVRTRNPYLLIGYAAFVPWGLLHLVAHSDIAGTLSGYYAFPFMIASFWPLVGVLLDPRRDRSGPGIAATMPLLAFAAMIAASFAAVGHQYNPGRFDLTQAFLQPPSLTRQTLTDHAVALLVRSKPLLGAVSVDGSVVALAPDDFAWTETVKGHGAAPPDTVVYFVEGYEAMKARSLAEAAGLARHYRIPGTSIRLATAHPVPGAAPIAPLLVAVGGSD